MNLLNQARLTIIREYNSEFVFRAFLVIIALLALVTVEWVLNITGLKQVNLVILLMGTLWILLVGLSPIAIGLSALTGGIVRTANFDNPLDGAAEGVHLWVAKIIPVALLSFLIVTGLLATWPFAKNPIAFWYVAAGCVVLTTLMIVYKKDANMLFTIVLWYAVGVILLNLASTFYDFGQKKSAATSAQASIVKSQEAAKTAVPHKPQVLREPVKTDCTSPALSGMQNCRSIKVYSEQLGGTEYSYPRALTYCTRYYPNIVERDHTKVDGMNFISPQRGLQTAEVEFFEIPKGTMKFEVMIRGESVTIPACK